jgi:hypothetical protein
MRNLLNIKRIPMDIEINVTPWKYEIDKESMKTKQAVTRPVGNNGSKPQSSTGQTAPMPVINDLTGRDHFDFGPAASNAHTYAPGSTSVGATGSMTNSYVEDDLVANSVRSPLRAQMASRPIESLSQSLSEPRQQSSVINWSNGRESMSFSADGAGDFQAIPARSEWKFVPSSVEVIINQLPGLEIDYVGSPLYFPRSADPNYVPPQGV